MKKLIVLLLALAMVGAVSAQVTTAISLSGSVTLVDQAGNSVFARDGNGSDTWTFKGTEKDGKYGFSITDQNILDNGPFAFRDWNVWFKGNCTKVFFGSLRNGDFRMSLPTGLTTAFGSTDRITGYGVLIESLPKNGLTLGVNLPVPEVATAAFDVLKKADLGAKFAGKTFTAIALLNFDFVTPANVLNLGASYTGTKDLTANATFQAKLNANTYKAALGFKYVGMAKTVLALEGAFASTAGVITWDADAEAVYNVTDKLSVTLDAAYGDAAFGYDVSGTLGYDYGNGFSSSATAGFDGAFYADVSIGYAVAF